MSFYKTMFFVIILLSLVLVMPPVFADTWYVGKGLKQGDFFRYNVCHINYHNCTPLEIDFWVKNQSSTSHDYFLQMFAIDGNSTQKGTVMTTPDLQPVYSDPNISSYSDIYKNTIIWLDNSATSETPRDFNSHLWYHNGVAESGFGSVGQEQVTVQAGSYNAWIIGGYRDVDAKIWVVPNMPFPVKAEIWIDSMGVKSLIDYRFELLETGNSKTEPTWNLSQIPQQQTFTVPEFPFTSIVLALSIISMIILYQFKFMSRHLTRRNSQLMSR